MLLWRIVVLGASCDVSDMEQSRLFAGLCWRCASWLDAELPANCLCLVYTLFITFMLHARHVRPVIVYIAVHLLPEDVSLPPQEFSADSTTSVHVFNYDATDSELMRLLVPPLNYVAPELISGTRATGALTSATDTYSFGEDYTEHPWAPFQESG